MGGRDHESRSAASRTFLRPLRPPRCAYLQGGILHQRQGYDIMNEDGEGQTRSARVAQDALNRFWGPALMMFRPSDENSSIRAIRMAWKIKHELNDELRQKFVR